MSDTSGPLDVLSRAIDQMGDVIAGIRPKQATLPTPCASFDVRTLVNHVLQDVQLFVSIATGSERHRRAGDIVADDWSDAYRGASDALLAAWSRQGILDETVHLPFGDRPASWAINQVIADLVVHAWDLARATGQSTDLDPEAGQLSLNWARETLTPDFRGDEKEGHAFGPEIVVAADAPLHDRLAAFFGRDPN